MERRIERHLAAIGVEKPSKKLLDALRAEGAQIEVTLTVGRDEAKAVLELAETQLQQARWQGVAYAADYRKAVEEFRKELDSAIATD